MAASIHSQQPPSYFHHQYPADDTVSILSNASAAPSYTSSRAPSYHSTAPAHHRPSNSRGNIAYSSLIPGTPTAPLVHHSLNVASWGSINSTMPNRTYLNVAARRARRAQEQREREQDDAEVRRALNRSMLSSPSSPNLTTDGAFGPGFVGASVSGAGGGARSRIEERDEILQEDMKAWDLFYRQAVDWEQREASWRQFRKRFEKPKKRGGFRMGRGWGLYSGR